MANNSEKNALLRAALDEVKRSHTEINQIRRLAEAWITDSTELSAQSGITENSAIKIAMINSCGRTVLSQLRPANAYTEDD